MRGRPPRRGRGDGSGGGRDDGGSTSDRGASARARRKARVTAVTLVILSIVLGTLVGVFNSDMFAVRHVLVHSPDESLAAEAAQRANEISFDTIWLPPMRRLEAEVGGLPRAKTVRVDRDLPGTLRILVEPRTPVAAVEHGDRFMMVDAEGMCMHWTGSVPDRLPRVRIEFPSSLQVGGQLSERDVKMMNAVRSGLEQTNLLAGSEIDLSRPVRVEVWTADGVFGKLGNEELLAEKSLLFGKLLHTLKEQNEAPLYIDLRVPSRPTFKRLE